MSDPEQQVHAAAGLVRREVLRQVIAPLRVIAVRMMLYYIPRYQGFERPWVSVRNAVALLRKADRIIPEKIGGEYWYHLPRVKPDKLEEARARKVPVNRAWTRCLSRAGGHAEVLWRHAFREEGWVAPVKSIHVPCPLPAGAPHSQEHEIDVYATLPGTELMIAGEVKNGPAEGWLDPELPRAGKVTPPQVQVIHHFAAMDELGLTPMLAAPFVDPSFYRFQARHRGLHAKYLYNVFSPRDADVAEEVRKTFRIGHVWARQEPPDNFRAWIRRIPEMIESMKGVAENMAEAEAEREAMDAEPDYDLGEYHEFFGPEDERY